MKIDAAKIECGAARPIQPIQKAEERLEFLQVMAGA